VVATSIGGKEGGGAQLTPLGETLVSRFRAMERDAATSLATHLDAFTAAAAQSVEPDRT
jgi:molybdate transport system regulatory protein